MTDPTTKLVVSGRDATFQQSDAVSLQDILTNAPSAVSISPTDLVAVIQGGKVLKATAAQVSGATAGDITGGTTAQRPASPALWQLYYDTTLGYSVIWNSSAWVAATVAFAVSVGLIDMSIADASGLNFFFGMM